MDSTGNEIVRSNFSFGTRQGGPAPVLVSDRDNTIRLLSGQSTTALCFNLLLVIQGNTVYLEKRPGKARVQAQAAILNPSEGVGLAVTEAPSNVRAAVAGKTGSATNFNPCSTEGVGVHTVTWSWNGIDGLASRAGTTSTTITVLPANVPR